MYSWHISIKIVWKINSTCWGLRTGLLCSHPQSPLAEARWMGLQLLEGSAAGSAQAAAWLEGHLKVNCRWVCSSACLGSGPSAPHAASADGYPKGSRQSPKCCAPACCVANPGCCARRGVNQWLGDLLSVFEIKWKKKNSNVSGVLRNLKLLERCP